MSIVSYAQSGEDLQIAFFVGRKHDVTYIDVGCLWPKQHSNSYFFYERGGVGLCIDPNPTVGDDFRFQRPRDTFLNCGIAGRRGAMTYFMHGNPVFNTFSPEVAAALAREAELREGAQREGRTLVQTIELPIMTLDDAIESTIEAPDPATKFANGIDFLSIDVEGLELEVLSGLSLDDLRPKIIVVEYIRPRKDRRRPDELPIAQLLQTHGYWLVGFTGHDLYFHDERQ